MIFVFSKHVVRNTKRENAARNVLVDNFILRSMHTIVCIQFLHE